MPFEVRLGKNGDGADPGPRRQALPAEAAGVHTVDRGQVPSGADVRVCAASAAFYLKETDPHFKLYMTPINIDPDKPALPISHPFTYAVYLSKTQGRYSTLGLAEDTWGLNERVLDEEAFLKQAWSIHDERERMFFDALEKTKRGTVVCVFDITDRLQHMFFRYLETRPPGQRGQGPCGAQGRRSATCTRRWTTSWVG